MPGEPELLPIFLKLADRPVLVVGAGPVAASKLGALLATGALLTVVAPEISAGVREAGVFIHQRPFQPSDLDGVWLVVAAATPAVNREVARLAEAKCLFVNAVDDPPNASAYLGGVLRRDGLTVAISTSGRAPALAGLIREGLDALLPDDLDRWFARADELKREWRSTGVPMEARRPQLMEALVRLYEDRQAAHAAAERNPVASARQASVGRPPVCPGFASLVGAGPGDPELLTYRAIRRLGDADLVLYDGLVPEAVVGLATRAEHLSVARRAGEKSLTQEAVSALIVDGAWSGKRVVRLKAGDPFVLGRGGEEILALAQARVPFEIVPGVSSAVAAPALAGIPVTHRGLASGFVVVSGHDESAYGPVLRALPPDSVTVVVLMGGAGRAGIRDALVAAGWSPATPAAIVVNASHPDQRVWTGELDGIDTQTAGPHADEAAVLIIGQVVSIATAAALTRPFVSEETPWQPSTIQRP